MKFIKVIGLVLFFHASLLGVLFFQPGCQTMETYDTSNQSQSMKADDFDFNSSSVDAEMFSNETCVKVVEPSVMNKNLRAKPTRPVEGSFDNKSVTSKSEISRPVASFTESSVQMPMTSYIVKSGDSLWVVAKRNGITVADLAASNGVSRDSVLKVGQKLMIPAKKGSAGIIMPSAEGSSYTIAKGDTLSEIAARFHVSVEALKGANNMKDNVIYAGKKIIIPGVNSKMVDSIVSKNKSSLEKISSSKDGTYQVKSGDSLSVIAGRFGVSVSDLMKWNSITDAAKLRAGQMLVVTGNAMKADPAPVVSISTPDKIDELDEFIIEPTEESSEVYNGFELFEDDMLFDTSEEIPMVTITEE